MVTNVPAHAEAASVLRSFVVSEDGFAGIQKYRQKNDSCMTCRRDRGTRDHRARNLLTSILISIDAFGKSGVALEY